MTSLRVPYAPASVRVARTTLVSELNGVGTVDPEGSDTAALVLSELLDNSIRHAEPLNDGQVLVSWSLRKGILQISVSDGGGPSEPRVVDAPLLAAGGRGMAIVEALAQRWWRDQHGPVSTVHALLLV